MQRLILTLSACVLLTNAPAQTVYPQLVKDVFPGYKGCVSINPGDLIDLKKAGNHLVFQAAQDYGGATDTTFQNTELFTSDGTASGTQLLADFFSLFNGVGVPNSLFSFQDQVYFAAIDEPSATFQRLHVTDGTTAGTQLLTALYFRTMINEATPPNAFAMDADHFLFAGDDESNSNASQLYLSDGTDAGTVLLKEFAPTGTAQPCWIGNFARLDNGKVVFTARTDSLGLELYVTDGTPGGTVLLKDINPGAEGIGVTFPSGMPSLHSDGTRVYFSADNGTTGMELWMTDGTEAGTVLLKDIWPGASGSFPSQPRMATLNGITYFLAGNDATGRELWKTDGTPAGTDIVTDLKPGPAGGVSYDIAALNGRIIFTGSPDLKHVQVYAYDPASGGAPQPIMHLFTAAGGGTLSDIPTSYIVQDNIFCNKLYFLGRDTSGERYRIGITDGTAAGSGILEDSVMGSHEYNAMISNYGASFVEMDGWLYYLGNHESTGIELYRIPVCAEPNMQPSMAVRDVRKNVLPAGMVYPNPSTDRIGVRLAAGSGRTTLAITDMAGRVVMPATEVNDGQVLSHHLPPGIYMVHYDASGKRQTEKLTVHR